MVDKMSQSNLKLRLKVELETYDKEFMQLPIVLTHNRRWLQSHSLLPNLNFNFNLRPFVEVFQASVTIFRNLRAFTILQRMILSFTTRSLLYLFSYSYPNTSGSFVEAATFPLVLKRSRVNQAFSRIINLITKEQKTHNP